MPVNITDVFLPGAPSGTNVTLKLSTSVHLVGLSLSIQSDPSTALAAMPSAIISSSSVSTTINSINGSVSTSISGTSLTGSSGSTSPYGDGIAKIDTR